MGTKSDTSTPKCCYTDTAGGGAGKLLSPPLTGVDFVGSIFIFIKKLGGAFPTVHSHRRSS